MRPKQASLGVALMAKNSEATLGKCLESIRGYVAQIVVGVDVLSTDKTAKLAKKAGADLVFPLEVSEPHECQYHGKVMAQHFAKARNATWNKLDRGLDAWMWLDADDTVKGAEQLKEIVQRLVDGNGVGAWMPYHYATLNDGQQTNTLFHRERIMRTKGPHGEPIVWEWQYRVHEVVAPKNVREPAWMMLEHPAVYHQEGAHRSDSSAARNLMLLEIDLEENPNDARAIFYMGNQYFAMGQWRNAVDWYERLGQVGKNHYELWQSWCYCSLAYERLGDLNAATQAAFCAIDVEPRHPEPYLRLASIYLLAGEHDKVLYWTEQAKTKERPPFFVFKNPLDYTFNARMPVADSLAALGRVHEARAELEEAYKVFPAPQVGEAIGHYRRLEDAEQKANAFLALADGLDDQATVEFWDRTNFPPDVRQFGRVRDRVIPALLRRRDRSQPRIVFSCGRALEEWSPLSLTTTGIGGSETAVVEIARRFARDGWRVDVYNGAGRYEGEYDGVGYWEPERLKADEETDVFVSWRQPRNLGIGKAKKALLWCHDLHYGPDVGEMMRVWDRTPGAKVLGVSAWHAKMLGQYYELSNADYVPNGIDLSRFAEKAKKTPFQCVYGSSPDRGLERVLTLWPAIVKHEPSARLEIAYGWDNIDKAISAGNQGLAAYKARVLKLLESADNVTWHGRLPQDQLAQLYQQSHLWIYPTSFLEVSCITAMEAMAAGAVPVTSAVGALPETIGDGGLIVNGLPESHAWPSFYLKCVFGALSAPEVFKPLEHKARERAQALTWDAAYTRWQQILEGLETPKVEMAGVA